MKCLQHYGWPVVVASIIFSGAAVASEPRDRLYAYQDPCAERGDSRKHEKVINPLQQHKILCGDSPDGSSSMSLPPEHVTLCNWNVYGLPVKNSGRRQANIADYIAYGCDIFGGQEHWSAVDRGRFRRHARELFPDWNFKYFGHPIPLHPGSGIMIGSIWPIQTSKYSPWPGGIFRNGGYKGVGYAQIKTPRGPVDLYNLHLAAGRSANLKEAQLEHLISFVNETHESPIPVVIMGDFNFNQRWKLPSKKVKALHWLNQALGVRSVGFRSRIEYTLLSDELQYVDHRVLADWSTPREVYMSEPFIREFGDHPGIITKIRFKD